MRKEFQFEEQKVRAKHKSTYAHSDSYIRQMLLVYTLGTYSMFTFDTLEALQSYPPVDNEGGRVSSPLPQVTPISSVNSKTTVEEEVKTSHSRKQFDLYALPLTVTLCTIIAQISKAVCFLAGRTNLDKDIP